MGVITFNNRSSNDPDIRIEVSTFPDYVIPEKVYEVYEIPGRNGDIIVDTGTYKNVVREYEISIPVWDSYETFSHRMNILSEWLYSSSGYSELTDSYEPEYYRMAYYSGELPVANIYNQAGVATLSFTCKPQRYLVSGKTAIPIEVGTYTLSNGTNFSALPLIEVMVASGSGRATINIGEFEVSIDKDSSAVQDIFIDSELQDCYGENIIGGSRTGTIQNKNAVVHFGASKEFPRIVPGINTIIKGSGINSLSITPRWWTI